jgi:CDP-diglyceride synthetase
MTAIITAIMSTIVSTLTLLFTARYLLAIFLTIIVSLRWITYRRLSNFKGPFWAGITNLWLARLVYLRKPHADLFHASQKYGLRPSSLKTRG